MTTQNPYRFNKLVVTRSEEAAAKMTLRSWWICDPAEFYSLAREEAPRLRSSTGSRWVEGLAHEHSRQYARDVR